MPAVVPDGEKRRFCAGTRTTEVRVDKIQVNSDKNYYDQYPFFTQCDRYDQNVLVVQVVSHNMYIEVCIHG